MKIETRGDQLGLHLVNPDGDGFFLYDKPLLSMWENRDRYILVKRRNREEKQAIGYHPGQVLGALDLQGEEVKVLLFFGPAGQDMAYDAGSRTLQKVVCQQVYCLPAQELEVCVNAFDVVRRNRTQFDEMLHVGRSMTLFAR